MATSSSSTSGLVNWARNLRHLGVAGSLCSWLGPYCCRRRCASSLLSPRVGSVCNCATTSRAASWYGLASPAGAELVAAPSLGFMAILALVKYLDFE